MTVNMKRRPPPPSAEDHDDGDWSQLAEHSLSSSLHLSIPLFGSSPREIRLSSKLPRHLLAVTNGHLEESKEKRCVVHLESFQELLIERESIRYDFASKEVKRTTPIY